MKQKKNWKPKLDFTSKDGVISAATILKGEGYDIRDTFHPETHGNIVMYPTIIFYGTKKGAMKAFKFAINQDWPVMRLSKVWGHRKGKPTDQHWRLNFARAEFCS